MGHPVCGNDHCMADLDNLRHRFCAEHRELDNQCAVDKCQEPVVPGTKTCSNAEHQRIEALHKERIPASFTLQQRYQNHRLLHPSLENTDTSDANVEYSVTSDSNIQMTVSPNTGSVGVPDLLLTPAQPPCPANKSSVGRKVKARFGISRGFCEFALSYPCGILVQHATFRTAEAVSNALLCFEKTFSVPGAHKPEHFIYDTNCDAKQQVDAHPQQWRFFKDIGMSVDVFHFLNKHAVTHTFCQEHNNPRSFPELLRDDGSWYFNSSIAEQNNVWLGGYHSMIRQMTAVKYNFFLDEMIRLRNAAIIAKLEAEGKNPRVRV